MKKLYRPVGLKELNLILDTNGREFPKRLPQQPIFYPVLNQEYAMEIAEKWNTKDYVSDFVGFITEFDVDADYVAKFESHIVGAKRHEELWIPAEELSEFNAHINVPIRISKAYYGEQYTGEDSEKDTKLKGNFVEQFVLLKDLRKADSKGFACVIQEKWKLIIANYIVWMNYDFSETMDDGEKETLLAEIRNILEMEQKWLFTF